MFLTVQEAIDISGKSQTTIHRLCQKHDGSKSIRKERNKYLIDKDFLLEIYPADENATLDTEEVVELLDEKLQEEIAEKNDRIAELALETVALKEELKNSQARVSELEDELFDHQHELAEVLDANIHIGKELSAVSGMNAAETTATNPDIASQLEIQKKAVRYTLAGGTISVMLLVAFIFMMYYLTK